MIDDIIQMTQKLRDIMKSNVPLLEHEINSIINNQERSPKRIEWILDTLLDYLYMGVGKEQFKRLNSYYKSICLEFSAEYDKFYHEIIDE
ncbi:MAG: hypothetical protein U9Q69_06110 [Nanoarchaeota archaeon]|nr:hypothetical protein [Nanoarchaeota archaeon]